MNFKLRRQNNFVFVLLSDNRNFKTHAEGFNIFIKKVPNVPTLSYNNNKIGKMAGW